MVLPICVKDYVKCDWPWSDQICLWYSQILQRILALSKPRQPYNSKLPMLLSNVKIRLCHCRYCYNASNCEYNVAKYLTLILSNLFAVLSTVTKTLPFVIGSVKLSVVLLLHLMYRLLFPFHPAAYCSLELACECVANGAL